MKQNIAVILTAAGSSDRFKNASSGGGISWREKKEYQILKNALNKNEKPVTVLAASVLVFAFFPEIDPVVITLPPEENKEKVLAMIPETSKEIFFVSGGNSRQESVFHALVELEKYKKDFVLIHDAARPWLDKELTERVMDAMVLYKAAIPVLPAPETPKIIMDGISPNDSGAAKINFISAHPKRSEMVFAQTPQGFAYNEILFAHKKAKEEKSKRNFTDDAEIWAEYISIPVAAVKGDAKNKKITFPEDLPL